jgi:hypothetical protein
VRRREGDSRKIEGLARLGKAMGRMAKALMKEKRVENWIANRRGIRARNWK